MGLNTMSVPDERNGMEEQSGENTEIANNIQHPTNHSPEDEAIEQNKQEPVKSFSPVVCIALTLAAFFTLGIYEV